MLVVSVAVSVPVVDEMVVAVLVPVVVVVVVVVLVSVVRVVSVGVVVVAVVVGTIVRAPSAPSSTLSPRTEPTDADADVSLKCTVPVRLLTRLSTITASSIRTPPATAPIIPPLLVLTVGRAAGATD